MTHLHLGTPRDISFDQSEHELHELLRRAQQCTVELMAIIAALPHAGLTIAEASAVPGPASEN